MARCAPCRILESIAHSFLALQCSIAFHEPYLRLIEKLLPLMPDPSLDSFFFWNSGSEAVEAALKMARTLTGRQNIITMQGTHLLLTGRPASKVLSRSLNTLL